MNTTRSHMRSTSSMLWLVTSRAVALVRTDVEQAGADAHRDIRVERRGRLVEHEQVRLMKRGLHDANERALSRRQLHAHAVAEFVMRKRARPRSMASSACVRAEPVEAGEDAERLAHAQAIGQWQVAGDEADLFHCLRSPLGKVMTHDLDLAFVGRDRAEQHEQGRGLAGAVGAEQPDALAGVHG